MAVKVLFPSGASTATVSGLYQWDFGQSLEIECVELGSEIMEVHFACTGMTEAIVRPCTFADGVGTVIIPDRCLEQTSTITAWIYSIDESQGHTVKTIILPIIARTRPSASRDVPAEYVDKYAEALTAINTAVNNLENGNVTVKKAESATNADNATTAQNATNATYATSAGSATTAGSIGISLAASCTITDGYGTAPDSLSYNTIYFVRLEEINTAHSGTCLWYSGAEANTSALGNCTLAFITGGGGRTLLIKDADGNAYGNGTLKFYKLGKEVATE